MITIQKLRSKRYYTEKYARLLKKYVPDYAYWREAKLFYNFHTKKRLNYKNPVDINEKLMWLSRYWRHPLKTLCADKFLVRNYLQDLGYGEILVPLINVYDNADEIDFSVLPNSFVLKCNHGSGFNIICGEKKSLNIIKTRDLLSKWLDTDLGKDTFEIHYLGIKRKIICEKYLSELSNNSLIDYKIHCINGEPQFFLVCSDRDINNHKLNLSSYSLKWEKMNYLHDEYHHIKEFPKPKNLLRMIEISKVISKPFPYVRVDFYEINERIYFGEMTYTPAANIMSYYKDSTLRMMGEILILPKKYN